MRLARTLLAAGIVSFSVHALAQQRADAVLIVNSASARYGDAQHLIRPYLDHFGVPYTTLDIATTPVGADVASYALIIIGHAGLDTTGQYLDATEQANLSNAVSQGSGLVNFDYDLTADGTTPRYRFVQDVFNFAYRGLSSGEGVVFTSAAPGHWVSSRHAAGQQIGLRQLPAGLVTPPASATVLARFGTTPDSGDPFFVVTSYGRGRAVQWASYDWMLRANDVLRGPLRGLDDLVWRGLAWAARKPFVMQGLPNFLTMRVDDAVGGFWWVHSANDLNLKPFLALFYQSISDADAADLAALVNGGHATASVHANGNGFFYFDHFGQQNLPDATVAANFQDATAWHANHGIPISSFVVPHFYEFGTNVFAGLQTWGVKSIATHMTPGQPYGAPWLNLAPFRLYEAGASDDGSPVTYADYVSIPGHPEFANQFFECVTEIRDDAGYEWYPDATDVAGTVGRGTRQAKRALDAMALATLFTHEPYIQSFAPADWRAALSGIVGNLAAYNPILVTMDYACEYLRAKHDSKITASVFDPASQTLTTDLGGQAGLATQFYVFTEAGGVMSQRASGVPPFSGTTRVTQQISQTVPTLTAIAVTPAGATLLTGASQQFDATGTYSDGSTQPLTSQVTWASSNAVVATITGAGLATGQSVGATSISATLAGVSGSTTLTVQTAPLAITTTSLPGGTQNVGYGATLAASGGSPPYAWSVSAGALPIGLALSASGAISGTPTTTGTFSFNVQVTDTAAHATTAPLSITIVAASSGAGTIWPDTAVPGTDDRGADSAIELGVKFRSDVDGRITGIRFYKSAANTGTHVGNLWSSTGTLLASATFAGETASGWQQVTFATPVTITANTTYVASYHTTVGHYARDLDYFATTGYDNPPLHALASGASGGNGVFSYGTSSSFPGDTALAANYWVDVTFTPGTGPAPTLTSITVAPASATVTSGATQPFTAAGTYSDGSTQNLSAQVTWASSNTSVATVSAAGLAIGAAAGTTTISATSASITGSGTLTVTPAVASISVTPASVRLLTGAPQQFTAVALDAQHNPISGATFAWSTTGGGSVSAAGVFTAGTAPGTYTNNVVASAGGVTGTASTEVVALTGVALAATTLLEGDATTATVTLSAAAPAGDATVTLSSGNGAVTVPASVTVPAGATSATFAVGTAAVSATTSATLTASLGGVSRTASASVRGLGVAVSPTSVLGGGTATATLTLTAAMPAAVTIALSSSSPVASVPASVTIAAGATTAAFTVTTSPVAASTGVTIAATNGTVSSAATLTVTAATFSALALSPAAVVEGDASSGTVTLSGPAPAGGAIVTLSSSSAAAVVPSSVTVAGGARTATFPISTSAVASGISATITASYAGTNRTATLSVRAVTVSVSPTAVGGGNGATGTVRLSGTVTTATAVTLSSSNTAAATVPATVTIAAGGTTATFAVATSTVTATTSVTITATHSGIPANATVSVRVIAPASLSLNPATVAGGTPSTGTVTLNYAAPAGGYVVTLASSRTTVATVPASVTVLAGSTTATFPITTFRVAANTSSSISARGGGVTRSATLTVTH